MKLLSLFLLVGSVFAGATQLNQIAPARISGDGASTRLSYNSNVNQKIDKKYLLEAFLCGDKKALGNIYINNPVEIYNLKKAVLEGIFSYLGSYAFCRGNFFSRSNMEILQQESNEIIATSFDAENLYENMMHFIINHGYTMSHLSFTRIIEIDEEEQEPYFNGHLLNVFFKFSYNQDICFIDFRAFNQSTFEDVSRALKHCMESNINIALNLSNNSGGQVNILVEILGFFLPSKTLIALHACKEVVEELYDSPAIGYDRRDIFKKALMNPSLHKYFRCTGEQNECARNYRGKIAVIVGGQSYSMAEHFAFTLQREHRATIIGSQTEGFALLCKDGFIKEPEAGRDIVTIKYPIGEFIHPNGESLEGRGVIPDLNINQLGIDECLRRWLAN